MSKKASKKHGKQGKKKTSKSPDSAPSSAKSSKPSSEQKNDEPADEKPAEKKQAVGEKKESTFVQPAPDSVLLVQKVDNGIGLFEQLFLVLSLFGLIGVGTYQFAASKFFSVNSTWPFEALRYLVFATAMGGAALSAQKGQMITMDFLSRKFPPKGQVLLRLATSSIVVIACYILFRAGLRAASATTAEEYEVIAASKAYLVLPIGAALIAVHYILHSLCDVLYLAAGQLPPEEEGPQAH